MPHKFSRWLTTHEEPEDEQPPESHLEFSEAELFLATHVFDSGQRLGAEGYSDVYRGTLRDRHEVAVKVLELGGQHAERVGLAEEVRLLSRLRHPNLATLLGWACGPERCYLVYELVVGCDVAYRLRCCQERGVAFDWAERLWVAADTAEGLSHMHGRNPQVFHRNLKSANILLDDAGVAKLVDFGLSGIERTKAKAIPLNHQLGTPGDACPEDIRSGRITEQTEAYAFGMFLFELLLNLPPVCLGEGGEFMYPIFQEIMPQAPGALERVLGALDLLAGWVPALTKELADLALACVAKKDAARPCLAEVAARLRELCGHHCKGARGAQGGSSRIPGCSGAQSTHPPMQQIVVKVPGRPQTNASEWDRQGPGERNGRRQPAFAQNLVNRLSCFLEFDPQNRCRVGGGCERPGDYEDFVETETQGALACSEETVYRL